MESNVRTKGLDDSPAMRRRAFLLRAAALGAAVVAAPRMVRADAGDVPAELQAELLAKLSSYDRNFLSRAEPTARVSILVRGKDASSKGAALAMNAALSRIERIGGLPHQ